MANEPAAAKNEGLAGLHPAYFALVMATGIVSIAAKLVSVPAVPEVLFVLNIVFYPLLWVLTIARTLLHRERVAADLAHHGRAVGFFTIVAATCVMGSQCLVVAGATEIARYFWVFGIFLYLVLVYLVFTILTVKKQKPPLDEGINGGWLVSVVAAQSVAALGAQLALSSDDAEHVVLFSLTMWLGGGMLYFWIISLIFYRYAFFTLAPSDLAPPYWINMGAAAISTLAGSLLVVASTSSKVVAQILPFVRGLTLMWWATATWWIPMLLVLGVWRHVFRRFPLRYDPLYWGAVFPLGMYTASTVRLSRAIDAPYLFEIPRWFVYAAISAWTLTFVAMGVQLARRALAAVAELPIARRRSAASKAG